MGDERLVEIETKLAYQEKTIRELNDVICEQQKEIEKLGLICKKLGREYDRMSSRIDAPANEKPPHY